MGVDLPRKAVATFKKAVDKAKIALLTGDLFTVAPNAVEELVQIEVDDGVNVGKGEDLILRHAGGVLWADRGNLVVGRVPAPPAHVLRAIEAGCYYFSAKIIRVHKLAGVAEAVAS